MGLSIRSLNNAVLVLNDCDHNECLHEMADRLCEDSPETTFTVINCNPHFPVQSDGLVDGIYKGDVLDEQSYPNWSYSGYNSFRDDIAKAVGYKSAEHVFDLDGGVLWELIKFSDCEGAINNNCCVKISSDLKLVDIKMLNEYDARMIKLLMNVFDEAADNNGVVIWG